MSLRSSTLTTIFNNLSQLTPPEQTIQQDDELIFYHNFQSQHACRNRIHDLSALETDKARSILLTLHLLFPRELLPALDILDRGLVTKLLVTPWTPVNAEAKLGAGLDENSNAVTIPYQGWEVFYIQSASVSDKHNSRSPYRHQHVNRSTTSTHYEVCLDSWNCSCPAFSVSAFHSLGARDHLESEEQVTDSQGLETRNSGPRSDDKWRFGGLSTLETGRVPSCKHILAAVLAKAAPKLFNDGYTEKVVSREEAVAWGNGGEGLWGKPRA